MERTKTLVILSKESLEWKDNFENKLKYFINWQQNVSLHVYLAQLICDKLS